MIGAADDKRFSHEFIVTVSRAFFEKVQENAFFCFTCQTNMGSSRVVALVAQLVEHLICNQGVAGSNPAGGTIFRLSDTQFAWIRIEVGNSNR